MAKEGLENGAGQGSEIQERSLRGETRLGTTWMGKRWELQSVTRWEFCFAVSLPRARPTKGKSTVSVSFLKWD